jgi:hypothetical protein
MAEEPRSAAMESGGAYNRYGKVPEGGAAFALPYLEQAILRLKLDAGGQPVAIADYGSSQGKNSLAPITVAVETLRRRVPRDRPVLIFHVDQPANDFNSLFEVLAGDTNLARWSSQKPERLSGDHKPRLAASLTSRPLGHADR